MKSDYIDIAAKDGGSFRAYLAVPDAGRGPGIVVLQEIFGVNKVMRDITDGLARDGYTALCPDLFWRIEPGIDITDKTQAEWDKAFELFGKFDVPSGVNDIQSTIDALRAHESCAGKVGAIGYCLGGLLAYLTACRTDADACVGYYGVGIADKLDEASNISKPLLLHVATEDQFVDKAAQKKMHAGLDDHPLVTLHDYQGNDHAFARVGGEHYDAKAAELANQRTMKFLKTHL
jgi:carboxymethylenebutenolidase